MALKSAANHAPEIWREGDCVSDTQPIVTFSVTNDTPDPAELAAAFPDVPPGIEPFGGRVVVQLRQTKQVVGEAGIILVSDTKDSEKWNNMIGRVVALGPLAFKNRDTMAPWTEGAWAQVGDFVRVPKWGGDRWEVPIGNKNGLEEKVLFATFNDHELIARVTGNPLSFKAFV